MSSEDVQLVLNRCQQAGVYLRVSDEGKLLCSPADHLSADLVVLIKSNREPLVEHIRQNAEIDPHQIIQELAEASEVPVSWIYQQVVDDFDLRELASGRLSRECIEAHIDLHKARQEAWSAAKQRILSRITLPVHGRGSDGQA